MHCHLHVQSPAVGICVGCGKFICEECRTEIKGKNYCKNCLEELLDAKEKKIESLEHKANAPMVFMNAGGGSSSSSSSSSSGGYPAYTCVKSKGLAGILAIFLGAFGIHKFYLGRIGAGILYLIFSWTGIPAIIGFIEGIVTLLMTDAAFAQKYGVAVRY